MRIAVLDIGGTSIKAGIVDGNNVEELKEFETKAIRGGQYVMKTAKEIIHTFGSDFERIGISTAGQVDSEKGIIRYANSNIPEYSGMEVKRIFMEEFHVPVAVENDVNAAAIGEAHFGAGRDIDNFLCLTYGTGVGGAIVLNREIYRGSSFSAGEVGGMLVHPEERNAKEDMFSGCYERYASTTALIKKAMLIDSTLSDGKRVFEEIGRLEVKKVVDEWIREIVIGLISLIHVFNPASVILGGGVMKQNYIVNKIKEQLYSEIIDSYRKVIVTQATLGNRAGLYGAAYSAYMLTEESTR